MSALAFTLSQLTRAVPPPLADPFTPTEPGPGTPNSTTTSLSNLSVVAIKDGAAGQNPHSHFSRGHQQSTQSLDAERADRISRLAGLERVATVRQPGNAGSMIAGQHGMIKEISTVGTASATGSVGDKTTWASESVDYDADKMSESTTPEPEMDHDQMNDETSSIGGMSDGDKASLVGFGEGASSTISGPISTPSARMLAARNAMLNQRPGFLQHQSGGSMGTPMSGIERPGSGAIPVDSKMSHDEMETDRREMTDQEDFARTSGFGTQLAESVMRDRIEDAARTMGTPPNQKDLGRFGFER